MGMAVILTRQPRIVKINRNDTGRGSEALGGILKLHREQMGWSQYRLGQLAGVDPSFLSKIEGGHRGMSIETFARIATVFQDSGDWEFAPDFIAQLHREVTDDV